MKTLNTGISDSVQVSITPDPLCNLILGIIYHILTGMKGQAGYQNSFLSLEPERHT
jgi:hypothetical protein